MSTRIFEGVQQPVCIVLALRRTASKGETPPKVRYRALPEGNRKANFVDLNAISLDDAGWIEAPAEPRAPFLRAGDAACIAIRLWRISNTYNGSGVMADARGDRPGRGDAQEALDTAPGREECRGKGKAFHPHLRNGKPGDKHVDKV